jgi:5'-3' exonuclease
LILQGSNRKKQNNEDYLRHRQHRLRQKKNLHTSTSSPNSNAGKLKPFIETIESIEGGISLVSADGYEADECIGAVCALFKDAKISSDKKENTTTTGKGGSLLSIVIASGDSDMQQYLNPTISWLHVAALPTLTAPAALSIVTETSFLSNYNFPPSAYTNYLALVGKKEASIGGVGIGSSVAAKLLKQFHSIKGIEQAAQQGILKGWPPAVEAIFSTRKKTASSRALFTQVVVERNLKIFSSSTDPEAVLTSVQREKLRAQAAARIRSNSIPSGNDGAHVAASDAAPPSELVLAWQHPLYAIRWLQAGPLAQNLARILDFRKLGPCKLQAATDEGLPIDLIIHHEGGDSGTCVTDGGIAVMICAPCDFTSSNNTTTIAKAQKESRENAEQMLHSILDKIEEARRGGGGGRPLEVGVDDPCHLGKKLHRAGQHHISLLKKAGVAPILIPWYILQQREEITE